MVNILLSQYNFNESWARNAVQKYINKNHKVAIISFAFSGAWISNNLEWLKAYDRYKGKYYREIVEPFLDFKICEDNITWINYFEDTEQEMRQVIPKSDIIFLTGGLPHKAVERVLEKNLLGDLCKAKVIMGASAGALMQLKDYYVSPDDDYAEFTYFKGLGFVNKDFYIEVHYKGDNIQNDCIINALNNRTNTVYAIKDNGGIIIDNKKLQLLGEVVTFTKE